MSVKITGLDKMQKQLKAFHNKRAKLKRVSHKYAILSCNLYADMIRLFHNPTERNEKHGCFL